MQAYTGACILKRPVKGTHATLSTDGVEAVEEAFEFARLVHLKLRFGDIERVHGSCTWRRLLRQPAPHSIPLHLPRTLRLLSWTSSSGCSLKNPWHSPTTPPAAEKTTFFHRGRLAGARTLFRSFDCVPVNVAICERVQNNGT